jgi:sterol desaturase/sphingolipid hydroxylase (fatty acid hydroxylase superfamily)
MSPVLSAATVAALSVTVAGLERVPALRFSPSRFLRRHLATDAAWYAIATTANVIAAFVFLPTLAHLAVPGVADIVRSLPLPARLAFAVVIYDFVAFAVHLRLHRSETLWAFHKVHHSSLQLDWLATTRAHMLENLVRQVAAQAPLFALGLTATTVAPALVVYAAFALYGHSNLRVGAPWIEVVFVTPRLHRLHHIPETTQSNFATIFTVWDRLFTRFVSCDAVPGEPVGVPGEIDDYPQTLLAALRRPFAEVRAGGRRVALAAQREFD